jgi:hypothetical protein
MRNMELRLKVSENKVPLRIFGSKSNEVVQGGKKLHKKEQLRDL